MGKPTKTGSNSSKANSNNSDNGSGRHRISGYVADDKTKTWWEDQLARVKKLEGLSDGCGMGVLLNRVCQFDIDLDLKSLCALTGRDGEEPAELTHKPVKRAAGRG